MKKLIAFTLSAALLLGPALALTPEEAFPAVNTYPGFIDVEQGAWYTASARVCCEVGLMQGTGHAFAPLNPITVGEVAAIAARMSAALTGEEIPMPTPKEGETLPWYAGYVAYLQARGVDVPEPGRQATRLEFLKMLHAVIPAELLQPINTIPSLPDTADEAVLSFYRAGILTGVDAYGTFAGDRSLARAEVASMAARIARPALRMTFTPADATLFTAAGLKSSDVLFTKGGTSLTAGQYLPKVVEQIAALEARDAKLGQEFNWFHTAEDGRTYRDTVLENALAGTGLTRKDATDHFKTAFDVQVFYSRYIDLTGGHL